MVDPTQLGRGLQHVRDAATEKGRAAMSVSAALFVWACVDDDAQWARETGSARSARPTPDFAPLADRSLEHLNPSPRGSPIASADESVYYSSPRVTGRTAAESSNHAG